MTVSNKEIEINNLISRFERLLELAKKNNGYIEPTLYESEIETILYSLKVVKRNERINGLISKLQ